MNLDDIIKSPMEYFDNPRNVVIDDHFSFQEKKEILSSWKDYCSHKDESESEGMMRETHKNQLHDVSEAIQELLSLESSMTSKSGETLHIKN